MPRRRNPKSSAPSKAKSKKAEDAKKGAANSKNGKASNQKKGDPQAKVIQTDFVRRREDAVSPFSFVSEAPNLSTISDQRLRVALDHLSKKASATKTKALEDLIEITSGPESAELIDIPMLQVWFSLYPRLSIEDDRRIRQLSHTLQGQLFTLVGRTAAPFVGSVVGPWLAGTFDSDRAIARAAKDAFTKVFETEDKRAALWTNYRPDILSFCDEVLLKETPENLSDPRNTDSELSDSKYSRVMVSTIQVLCQLLEFLKLEPELDLLSDIIGADSLWELASSTDPYLRRAIFKLLRESIVQHKDIVEENLELISEEIISKAIIADQTASATQYIETLTVLSLEFPSIWSAPYSAESVSVTEFRQFLANTAQGATDDFWAAIAGVFPALPQHVLPQTFELAKDTVEAIRQCIVWARGPKVQAWKAFLAIVSKLRSCLQDQADKDRLLHEALIPLIEAFFAENLDPKLWSAREAPEICSALVVIIHRSEAQGVIDAVDSLLQQQAQFLSDKVVESGAGTDTPAVSAASAAVLSLARRWYQLSERLIAAGSDEIREVTLKSSQSIFDASLQALSQSSGKMHASVAKVDRAAGNQNLTAIECLSLALNTGLEQLIADQGTLQLFLTAELPNIMLSYPSETALRVFDIGERTPALRPATEKAVSVVIKQVSTSTDPSASQEKLVRILPFIAGLSDEQQQIKIDLGAHVLNLVTSFLSGQPMSDPWYIVSKCMTEEGAIPQDVISGIFDSLQTCFEHDSRTSIGIKSLHSLLNADERSYALFAESTSLEPILNGLFRIRTVAEKDLAAEADAFNGFLLSRAASSSANQELRVVFLRSLANSLQLWATDSPRIENLVKEAALILSQQTADEKGFAIKLILEVGSSITALETDEESEPNRSTAVLGRLEGAVFLVQPTASSEVGNLSRALYEDLELGAKNRVSFSPVLRFHMFVAELLLGSPNVVDLLSTEGSLLLQNMLLVLAFAEDNVEISNSKVVYKGSSLIAEDAVMHFGTAVQKLLTEYRALMDAGSLKTCPLVESLSESSAGTSSKAFYHARALSKVISELTEGGFYTSQQAEEHLTTANVRKGPDPLRAVALITGFSDLLSSSAVVNRLQNELVSDLMGTLKPKFGIDGLRRLVLLNSILKNVKGSANVVPQRRILMFIKHVLSILEDNAKNYPAAVCTETAKVVKYYLSLIDATYGDHWHAIFDIVHEFLTVPRTESGDDVSWKISPTGDEIPLLHETFKLYSKLGAIKNANPDIQDGWRKSEDQLAQALLDLLSSFKELDDHSNLPVSLLFQAVSRLTSKFSMSTIKKANELIPLIDAYSQAVQSIAFTLLHKYIPYSQETVSYEVALSNSTATLPQELVGLIKGISLDNLEESGTPKTVRRYLLSWILVFDHFRNATPKVKNDYLDQVRSSLTASTLLDLIFQELLVIAGGRPIDASKLPALDSYAPDTESDETRDLQWLLLYTYYSSVKAVPALTKSWWLSLTQRQIRTEVEVSTQKYITPLVIASELEGVTKWGSQLQRTQEDEEGKFHVKVIPASKEVVASYDVDEDAMRIVVKIPPTYPLNLASVEGLNRVALDEKKWKGFMMNAQGAIVFNNGSIVDGLNNWKRNIGGAMKGQTECAICYSIISGESYNKLPDRKCSTCKHLFHNSCLSKWFKSSSQTSCPLCRNEF